MKTNVNEDYLEGYDDGKEDGFMEAQNLRSEADYDLGWDECKAHYGFKSGVNYKQVLAQRDSAWNYLRDNEIHILEEYCWCGPTRHFVEAA